MKNNDTEEEDNINITLGENDSELVERLKEIIDKTSHKLPNTKL